MGMNHSGKLPSPHSHISSDAHDFDLCLKLSDILIVTAFHKSILPTLEFSLQGEKEVSELVYSTLT